MVVFRSALSRVLLNSPKMPPPPRRRSSRSSSRWFSASPTRAKSEESGRGAAPARLAPIRSAREEATSLPTAASQPKPSPPTVTKAAPNREEENKSSETTSRAHSPAPASGGSGSSFSESIKEGFGFGAGSQLGHRAVDGIMGPQTVKNETSASPVTAAPAPNTSSMGNKDSGVCALPLKTFQECLDSNTDDISKCQFYMDMLSECKKNIGSMINA